MINENLPYANFSFADELNSSGFENKNSIPSLFKGTKELQVSGQDNFVETIRKHGLNIIGSGHAKTCLMQRTTKAQISLHIRAV